jgi:hypothetical protein
MMTSRRSFQFSALEYESMPEMSPKQKPNPEPLTSGDSNFKSATGGPASELTEQRENLPINKQIEKGPQVKTKQTQTEQIELIERGPQIEFEETHDPLVILLNLDPIHHTHPSKTFSLPFKNTTNLLLFTQSPWLNLLTEQENLTSTNTKPSTVTKMVQRVPEKCRGIYGCQPRDVQ